VEIQQLDTVHRPLISDCYSYNVPGQFNLTTVLSQKRTYFRFFLPLLVHWVLAGSGDNSPYPVYYACWFSLAYPLTPKFPQPLIASHVFLNAPIGCWVRNISFWKGDPCLVINDKRIRKYDVDHVERARHAMRKRGLHRFP